jgi:hypothetical protein
METTLVGRGALVPVGEGYSEGPKQAKWFQSGKRQATSKHRKRISKKVEV